MFADRPAGYPFFARILSLDLECPKCGRVWHCGGRTSNYNRRTGRFHCPGCDLHLAVGVIVYPVTRALGPVSSPPDWTPTYIQGLLLREQTVTVVAPIEQKKGWTDPHNVVLREECRCELRHRGLIVHPLCPIHGTLESL